MCYFAKLIWRINHSVFICWKSPFYIISQSKNIEVESYEFDEKVPYAWSQETDKYKKFYGNIRQEVERENLLKKFESEDESINKKQDKVRFAIDN